METLTEFDNDLKVLAEIIQSKNDKQFRRKLLQMFDKMQTSNTKEFYRDKINDLCKLTTGETYERLFLMGIPKDTTENS